MSDTSNPPPAPTPPSIDTLLENYATACYFESEENGSIEDVIKARDELLTLFESIMLEVIGDDDVPESEQWRYSGDISGMIRLRKAQRTKAAAALERLRNG